MAEDGFLRNPDAGQIGLMPGGAIISTPVGAFGQSLKETRLIVLRRYLTSPENRAKQQDAMLYRPHCGHMRRGT